VSKHSAIEHQLRALCEAREYRCATTAAIEVYGRELMRFLISQLGVQRGEEAFSELLEDCWRGLPAFEWRSSLRTWLYVLARHIIARMRRVPVAKTLAITGTGPLAEVPAATRSQTPAHLKTNIKERFRALREQLPDGDQVLLVLRIDSNLPWRELARIMSDSETELSDAELEAFSVRLRQRYQAAKARLRKLAEDDGLLRHSE